MRALQRALDNPEAQRRHAVTTEMKSPVSRLNRLPADVMLSVVGPMVFNEGEQYISRGHTAFRSDGLAVHYGVERRYVQEGRDEYTFYQASFTNKVYKMFDVDSYHRVTVKLDLLYQFHMVVRDREGQVVAARIISF